VSGVLTQLTDSVIDPFYKKGGVGPQKVALASFVLLVLSLRINIANIKTFKAALSAKQAT
jgi:hypothetical protein